MRKAQTTLAIIGTIVVLVFIGIMSYISDTPIAQKADAHIITSSGMSNLQRDAVSKSLNFVWRRAAQCSATLQVTTGGWSDGETITIESEIYEVDNNSSVGTGDIAINCNGGACATVSGLATAIVTAINANSSVCKAYSTEDADAGGTYCITLTGLNPTGSDVSSAVFSYSHTIAGISDLGVNHLDTDGADSIGSLGEYVYVNKFAASEKTTGVIVIDTPFHTILSFHPTLFDMDTNLMPIGVMEGDMFSIEPGSLITGVKAKLIIKHPAASAPNWTTIGNSFYYVLITGLTDWSL